MFPGREPHQRADAVRLPAGVRPRPAHRRRPCRTRATVTCRRVSQWYGDTRYTLAFGQGVAATRDADGRGVRDDRQRRRAGAADPDRGHHQLGREVHPGLARRRRTGSSGPRPRTSLLQIMQQVAGHRRGGQPAVGGHPRLRGRRQDRTSQESNGKCALCIYGSSWIGMAPGDKPQLIVSVNVQTRARAAISAPSSPARSSTRS